MALTKKAITLLRKVKKHILAEPRRIYMDGFAIKADADVVWEKNIKLPACGTVGCIGGWTVMLSDKRMMRSKKQREVDTFIKGGFHEAASKLLGLTANDTWNLFYRYGEWWPENGTPMQKAKATAARIDRFIVSGGKE